MHAAGDGHCSSDDMNLLPNPTEYMYTYSESMSMSQDDSTTGYHLFSQQHIFIAGEAEDAYTGETEDWGDCAHAVLHSPREATPAPREAPPAPRAPLPLPLPMPLTPARAPAHAWRQFTDSSYNEGVRQDLGSKWEQFDVSTVAESVVRLVFQESDNEDPLEIDPDFFTATPVSTIDPMPFLYATRAAPSPLDTKPTKLRVRVRNKTDKPNHTMEQTSALRLWMEDRPLPYATSEEKIAIANTLGITKLQVNNFCNNYRKRYHKTGDKMESYACRASPKKTGDNLERYACRASPKKTNS